MSERWSLLLLFFLTCSFIVAQPHPFSQRFNEMAEC